LKEKRPHSNVGERLYAVGKLYNAKKEILRDRREIELKQEEDKIIDYVKQKHRR
jgi:hypothetical protein